MSQPKAPRNSDISPKLDDLDIHDVERLYKKSFTSGVLDFPLEEMPEDMQYAWVPMSIYTEPIPNAEARVHNLLWRKVPQERHPTQPVVRGGQVLYEIPKKFYNVGKKVLQEEINRQTEPLKEYSVGGTSVNVDNLNYQSGSASTFGKPGFGK